MREIQDKIKLAYYIFKLLTMRSILNKCWRNTDLSTGIQHIPIKYARIFLLV